MNLIHKSIYEHINAVSCKCGKNCSLSYKAIWQTTVFAIQNGRKVKAYPKQPITFQVLEN